MNGSNGPCRHPEHRARGKSGEHGDDANGQQGKVPAPSDRWRRRGGTSGSLVENPLQLVHEIACGLPALVRILGECTLHHAIEPGGATDSAVADEDTACGSAVRIAAITLASLDPSNALRAVSIS